MKFFQIIIAVLITTCNSSFSPLIDPSTLSLVSITRNETIVFYELKISSELQNELLPNSAAHTFGIYQNNTLIQKLSLRGANLKNLQKLEKSQLITGTYTTVYTTYPNSILSVWNVQDYSLESSIKIQANVQKEIDVWTTELFQNQEYLFTANSLFTNSSNYTQLEVYSLVIGDSIFSMQDQNVWMCKGVATTSSMIAYIGTNQKNSIFKVVNPKTKVIYDQKSLQLLNQSSEFIYLTSFAYDSSNYIFLGLTLSNDTFLIYNLTAKSFITNIQLNFTPLDESSAQCIAIKASGILFSCFKPGNQNIYIYQGILPILINTVKSSVPIYAYDTLFDQSSQNILVTYATSTDIIQVNVPLQNNVID